MKKKICVFAIVLIMFFIPSMYVFALELERADPGSIILDGGNKIFFFSPPHPSRMDDWQDCFDDCTDWPDNWVKWSNQPPTGVYTNTDPYVLIYGFDESVVSFNDSHLGEFFFSEDGTYLTLLSGTAVDVETIWFFENGKLIKSYLFSDLGIKESAIDPYDWLGGNWVNWKTPPEIDASKNTITITAVDENVFVFDMATGDFSVKRPYTALIFFPIVLAGIAVAFFVNVKRKKAGRSE
jgi:hypothetical protein